MAGSINVKHNGVWKSVNFGSQAVWVKHSGTWKEPSAVYVKHNSTWKKVYPVDSEAWTTSNLGTSSERKTLNDPPNLSTDPTYVYTNINSSNSPVRWSGRSNSEGQYVRTWGFGWSPVTTSGFSNGAITRLEVSLRAAWIQVPGSGEYFRIRVTPSGGSTKESANISGPTLTTYTYDYTISDWGLTDSEAAALHSGSGKVQVAALYNNSTGFAFQEVEIRDVKARIKYEYVS